MPRGVGNLDEHHWGIFLSAVNTIDIFREKVQLVYDHVLSAYGDDGESVYSRRVDFGFPDRTVGIEPSGPIDVNKVADDVVARIHADPTFAERVARQLRDQPDAAD